MSRMRARRAIAAAAGVACLCAPLPGSAHADRASDEVSLKGGTILRSPDGRLEVEVFARGDHDPAGPLQYRVRLSGKPVLLSSSLGNRLADGTLLGRDATLLRIETRRIDTSFEQFPGKRRLVIDRANEATFTLREHGATPLEWQLVLRAYDDGIGLRYRFPRQPGWTHLALAGETTEFAFPADAVATTLPLGGFTTSHEGRYERREIAGIPPGELAGLPVLVELPRVGWAAVLEANVDDYAGLYLQREIAQSDRFVSRLSPRPGEPGLAVRAKLPHESPWRLVLVGNDLRQLVESDTVLKLNAPSRIPETSWIHPGKTTFPWWNDYFEVDSPFAMGLNTDTAQYYIDFCAEYGIAYHTLDGFDGQAWYGGPIVPYEGADITRGIDGLNLKAVIAHARQKGVGLRLWLHWEAAKRHMARAFPLYRAWGIEGVMIDFMDRDDQDMIAFQRELLQLAADNHLTVTFHGVSAPTGIERTFPNLLNSEAVLNLEHDKWDDAGVMPEHDVTVPFTRMLAGPLDYHQGSLRGVPLTQFKAKSAAPLVVGTPCRMLASYVVLQNHLPMMADYPSAYRSHPLTRVAAGIPASWDDTRALIARPGETAAIARRNGEEWWIGAMTDRRARDLRIGLAFLPAGRFQAEIYRDDAGAAHGYARESRIVTSSDSLDVQLAEAGGSLVQLKPIPRAGAP